MKYIICVLVFVLIVSLFISFRPVLSQQKLKRYRFETEKVLIKGDCPDSIRASVYDAVQKKVLHYSFKNKAKIATAGGYYTVKATEKGKLISGQIIDCSSNTIAIILSSNDSKGNEELVVKLR